MDEDALMTLAGRMAVVLDLLWMPGDFVPRDAPLFHVHGRPPTEDEAKHMRGLVFIEDERTTSQDPAFGFRQLVDIAERALSPGVNDPSTAVQALDEIHDLLRTLAVKHFPSSARFDDAGMLRLILPRPSWESYVRLALDEIRHYGATSTQITRRLQVLLDDCLSVAPAERRDVLDEQLQLLHALTAASAHDRANAQSAPA